MKQLNWYQIFGKSNIPDGRTVLPTDDIQILLHCANIWDKTYTTLAELLADTDTLLAVISSNNAIDYLVRSTTWAVASALVPTMTDDTHPSGVCSASSVYDSRYPVYQAFDKNDSTEWVPTAYNNNSWIQYKFDDSETIFKFTIKVGDAAVADRSTISSLVVSSGDSEGTLNTVASYSPNQKDFDLEDTFTATQGQYWRVTFTHTNNARYTMVPELQFYSEGVTDNATAMTYIGQNNYCANTLLADATWCNAICNSEYFESVLNVKVPKMTSNTTPEGVAFGDATRGSGYEYYRVFDQSESTLWDSGESALPHNVGYQFTSEISVHKISLTLVDTTGGGYVKDFTIQASNDSFTDDIQDVYNGVGTNNTAKTTVTYCLSNNVKRQSFRLKISSNYKNGVNRSALYEVQFYGRKDI